MEGQIFSQQINVSPEDTSIFLLKIKKEKKKTPTLNFKATSIMWFKLSGSDSSDYLSFTLDNNFSMGAGS